MGYKYARLLFPVPPMIEVEHQLVGALEGQELTLKCNSEAYPKSINYWTRDKDAIVLQGKLHQKSLYGKNILNTKH